jgi:periplasmic protein TonB
MNQALRWSQNLRAPLPLSFLLHLGFVLVVTIVMIAPEIRFRRKVEFEVIQYPAQASNLMQIKPPKEEVKPPPKEVPRAVFGVSRKAMTADAGVKDAAEVKQGNTVAKAQDDLQLDKNDADNLPIPTDDFLISAMPRLKAEVRIPYPEQAKKAGIEGPVVMDLLIDTEGLVRRVDLIKGPGFGLNEAALQAAEKFQFIPGRVGEQSVAVKIRYTYRFVLENR